jgi:LPXTG-motif cell wall-anchored protein
MTRLPLLTSQGSYMFSVRGSVPRTLTILSLTGLGLIGLAGPASAHTGTFTRDCNSVTISLTRFAPSPTNDPNVVDVFRDGTKIRTITFTDSSHTERILGQPSTGTFTYEAKWDHTGADNVSGDVRETKEAPEDCAPPPPQCRTKGTFTYTFDGPAGKATVTLTGREPLCTPVTVLLASYHTQGATAATAGHHTVANQVSKVITKPGSYPLTMTVPNCFAQVDLYVTDRKAADFNAPDNPLGEFLASHVWPGAGPLSMWNGGTACVHPTPTTSAAAPPPPAAAAASASHLPDTGASPLPKIGVAVLLLVTGTGLVLVSRRRRATN